MQYDSAKITYFRERLFQVAGQALEAAQYQAEDNPTHIQRGLIRFCKLLDTPEKNIYGFIEWQLLAFEQSPMARFRINLLRNQGLDARAITGYPARAEHSLAYVIRQIYQAEILPTDDYWWSFRFAEDLPPLLAESGKLLFGYGVPWLEMRQEL